MSTSLLITVLSNDDFLRNTQSELQITGYQLNQFPVYASGSSARQLQMLHIKSRHGQTNLKINESSRPWLLKGTRNVHLGATVKHARRFTLEIMLIYTKKKREREREREREKNKTARICCIHVHASYKGID